MQKVYCTILAQSIYIWPLFCFYQNSDIPLSHGHLESGQKHENHTAIFTRFHYFHHTNIFHLFFHIAANMFPFPKEVVECDGGAPTGMPNTSNPQVSGIARLIQRAKDAEARAMAGNYQDASVFDDSDDDDDGLPTIARAVKKPRAQCAPPCQARQPLEAGPVRAATFSMSERPLPIRRVLIPGAGAGRTRPPQPSRTRPATDVPPLDFFEPWDREAMAALNRQLHANYLRDKAARDAATKAREERDRREFAREALEGTIETAIQTQRQIAAGEVLYRHLEPAEEYMMRCFPEQMLRHDPLAVRAFLETHSGSRFSELARVFAQRCREERQQEEDTTVGSESPDSPEEPVDTPGDDTDSYSESSGTESSFGSSYSSVPPSPSDHSMSSSPSSSASSTTSSSSSSSSDSPRPSNSLRASMPPDPSSIPDLMLPPPAMDGFPADFILFLNNTVEKVEADKEVDKVEVDEELQVHKKRTWREKLGMHNAGFFLLFFSFCFCLFC